MYKSVSFYGAINERTGYGIHASRFCEALEKLLPVYRNQPGGEVSISLIDSVSIQNVNERLPYPSLLYNIWESTAQPDWFMERLKYFDGLLVGSEWQRAASIAQGVPEEFVKVVPEGVDPDIYQPGERPLYSKEYTFDFLHVGQWQPRKSTLEICQAFLKAFPDNKNVRLYLSADTLFPSDSLKSTEERLAYYGLNDPRIIPIHFEEREEYIRRLQAAHCFVSCSRSEGWGLPIIEAIACGAPTIVADWSGSTEYAGGAIRVPIRKLIKPYGIYGNWDVPGQWCEPDFDYLESVMRNVYASYSAYKEAALKESEIIRTKFSWAAAAKKALDIINEIPAPNAVPEITTTSPAPTLSPEDEVRAFARARGYEIKELTKCKIIFTMDTHPDSPDKLQCLKESIEQVKALGYPLLVTAHYPLPADVIELVDFYIYDKRDIMSGEDRPIYWRRLPDGTVEHAKSSIPCHAVASTMNCRNGIDFCMMKGYDWIYHMSSDAEIDLPEWVKRVQASDKSLIGIRWDHQADTFGGQLIAGTVDVMDKLLPRIDTWEEFVKEYGEQRFNSEQGMLRRAKAIVGDDGYDILDMEVGNRFDQVDKNAWKDEIFQAHFVEGPFLNIAGNSDREYDVMFSNSIDGDYYGLKMKAGMWARPDKKYFRDWTITAKLRDEIKFQHTINLKGKNILMSLGSKALGDTLAWIPYVEEFRKKHGCEIYLSTWWNGIMDYPDIHFITPGSVVENVYASYSIGCFDDQKLLNPVNWRKCPLQKVAADILGLDYVPIRPRLEVIPSTEEIKRPYVCFSEFSTMRNKLWNNPGAWQKVIDYLVGEGFECHSISTEQSQLEGIVRHNGQSIEQTVTDISGAAFYIGLNAGPTWLAYALNKPVIMITGVSEEWNDFPNPHRVDIGVCKPGCFNNTDFPINRGWEWCPRDRDYQCTREITPEIVIAEINKVRKEITHAGKIESATTDDGDSRKPSRNAKLRKPGRPGNGKGKNARVCEHQGEGAAQA